MTRFFGLPLAAIVLFSAASCSDTTELGLSLVEQEQSNIIYSDTLSLLMRTQTTEPFKTSSASRWLAGEYIDPVFGEVNAGFYANFRIPTTNISFPNCTVDSLVLSLTYDTLGHYGSILATPTAQNWEVLELSEAMESDVDYKANASFATKPTALATLSFTPNFRDTVLIDTQRLAPHLRIRLDNSFAETLLNPTTTDAYTTNNNFKSYFKGVLVRPQAGGSNDCLIRFMAKGTQTKLTLYYTDNSTGSPVKKSFSYLTDEDAESVVALRHDYTGTVVLDNNPTDTLAYLQGANGVSIKVMFPTLANLGKIVVNKAELIFQSPFVAQTEYPSSIQLVAAEKEDTTYVLIDDLLTSLQRTSTYQLFDGTRQTVSTDLHTYKMNISQYFQAIVDNEIPDSALYLQAVTALEPFRVALVNQNGTAFKAKLYLTYTKID